MPRPETSFSIGCSAFIVCDCPSERFNLLSAKAPTPRIKSPVPGSFHAPTQMFFRALKFAYPPFFLTHRPSFFPDAAPPTNYSIGLFDCSCSGLVSIHVRCPQFTATVFVLIHPSDRILVEKPRSNARLPIPRFCFFHHVHTSAFHPPLSQSTLSTQPCLFSFSP